MAETDEARDGSFADPPESEGHEPAEATDYGSEEGDQDWETKPDDDTEDDEEPAPPKAGASRRTIDPQVADVLREEAEREERARQNDQRGGLETQQELGLSEASSPAQRRFEEARARMARLRGEAEQPSTQPEPETEPETEPDNIDPGSRSNLLPDIDEISSSLNSDKDRGNSIPTPPPLPDGDSEPQRKSAFRSGFRLVLVLAILATALYIFAPKLSELVPALSGPLASYVEMVNGLRLSFNGMIEGLAASLSQN